jgi:SAM-dependent methyltransferase
MDRGVIKRAGSWLRRSWLHHPALIRLVLPLQPVSREFGADRGQPLDRYYIETFLSTYAADITGDVLEIETATYTRQFGQQVKSFHTLHVAEKITPDTIVADLSQPEGLPQDRFDCFICTQTFQYIYDFEKGVVGAHRLLKPGGVVLATMPTVSQKSVADDRPWKEYWRVTSDAAERAFGAVFGPENVQVNAYGNALVAAAFLLGLAVPDLPKRKRDVYDPHYQCLVAVRATKTPSA